MTKWKESIFKFGNKSVVRLFYVFFAAAYLFSILSPNLQIGDNDVFGTSTTLFLILFIAGIVLAIALFFSVPSIKKQVVFLFVEKQHWTATVLFSVLIIGQIVFIQNFHPVPGWDVNAIHMALIHPENKDVQSYFSLNQNNLPILLVQVKLAQIFGSYSWLFLDYVTLALVDLAAVMVILAATLVNRKNYAFAVYLQVVFLAMFPWIIVPYTDTWVLPFVAGILVSYVVSQKATNLWLKGTAWFFVAIFSVGCYFIKPSTVIPLIAIVIMELLFCLRPIESKKQKSGRTLLVCLSIFTLTFVGGYKVIQNTLQNQQQISIDKSRGIPMIHFMNTGMSKDGAYDPEAALQMIILPTKQEKIDYSKEQIKQRLKDRGLFGYISFLIQKHRNNTADGTFSWGKEGTFFQENPKPESKSGLNNFFKHSLFIYGDYIGNFRFIAQVVWIMLLSFIFFGWKNRTKIEQMLRLALIGGFMFLLIFEGGRSRYLIQFLPVFLLLATLTATTSWQFLSNLIGRVLYPVKEKA